jgi:4-hydroxybenzoate polyprenyltransferase
MKKLLQPVFDFILFSNTFMALCAIAQGLVTFYLIGSKPIYPVLALLFVATLGLYSFSILLGKHDHPEDSPYIRQRWFFGHHRLMVTITIVCFLALIPLFFAISNESKVLLIFLAVISFTYSLPLFSLGDKKFGLRNIPGLKQFLITLVWTMSTVVFPLLEAQHHNMGIVTLRDATILIAKRFLLIGALSVPFDIRDLFYDRQTGLKTIPTMWGEKNAYLLCQVLLGGYIVLMFLFRHNGFNNDFWALTITAVLAGWLIFRSTIEKDEYYYFFGVDGILILQYLMLLAFSKISF